MRVESRLKSNAIALDSLPWKEVALPDRLEDAEGFFGLEEIEDVDIVRDAQTGKVQYKVGEPLSQSQQVRGSIN